MLPSLIIPLQEGRELSLSFPARIEKVLKKGEKRGILLLLGKKERLELWEDDVEERRKGFYSTSSYSYTLQGEKREGDKLVLRIERNVQIKADLHHHQVSNCNKRGD